MFPGDLLLAGRLFSVSTGFVTLIGMITLAWYLWGRRAGYIAGVMYALCPFFLFYDRMALVDSGVNAAVIWILFFSILLVRTMRIDVALMFGVVAGIGLLAKSSVFLFLGLSAASSIFLLNQTKKCRTLKEIIHDIFHNRKRFFDYFALFIIVIGVAVSLYLTQKFFSPFFHYIAEKNFTFILSPAEWLAHPFALMFTNIRLVPMYVAWESGWLPALFGLLGIWQMLKHDRALAIYFLIWIIVPFILITNFNKVLYPRYLIFFPSFLVLLSTYYFTSRSRSIRDRLIIVSTILILGLLSSPILFNVKSISLPSIDRGQYIEGSTAVWGASELMEMVRSSTKDGKRALILAEGTFGLIADVLEVYKRPGDKIDIQGLWPLKEEHIYTSQTEATSKHVFVVFSHQKEFPIYWQTDGVTELVKKYTKPNQSEEAVYLFRVKPKSK